MMAEKELSENVGSAALSVSEKFSERISMIRGKSTVSKTFEEEATIWKTMMSKEMADTSM